MAIFITGGTGFIGRKLVEKLSLTGEDLHLLVRCRSNLTGLEKNKKVGFFYGDVTDIDSVLEGMKGCDKVFHLAAYARNWSFEKDYYYKINVAGAVNVFESALKSKVKKIVFTSSCVTSGPSQDGVITEKDWKKREHFYTEYEKSKYLAEIEALKFVEKGLDLVMVNPTRVYGPGLLSEANSVTRIVEQYLDGKFPVILNKGKEVANYVLVDDVATGIILAMEKGRVGERYILGGENTSLKDFFSLVDEISEDKHRQINVPPGIARFIAGIEEKKAVIFKLYPAISPDWVDTFLQNWPYSSAKAEEELGYRYHPLKEGLKTTCDWILSQKKSLG